MTEPTYSVTICPLCRRRNRYMADEQPDDCPCGFVFVEVEEKEDEDEADKDV